MNRLNLSWSRADRRDPDPVGQVCRACARAWPPGLSRPPLYGDSEAVPLDADVAGAPLLAAGKVVAVDQHKADHDADRSSWCQPMGGQASCVVTQGGELLYVDTKLEAPDQPVTYVPAKSTLVLEATDNDCRRDIES